MTKRFIILVDFSEYSTNLMKFACDWSLKTNAEIHLVHQTLVALPALTDNQSRQQITQEINNEALKKLKGLTKDLIPNSIKVTFSVSERNLYNVLQKLVAEPFDNLIFAGLKGTGLLKKILMGSVALKVIDTIQNIVVAMPKELSSFSQEKIFIAVTEKHPLNIPELNHFLNFIDNDKSKITFFHLAKPKEKTENIEKHLKDLQVLFSDRFDANYKIFEGENPFKDIKKVINSNIDELLVVQKGSRLLTDQLFRRFLINELVYEGQTPLIVLP